MSYSRSTLDFRDGTSIAVTLTDDSANDAVQIKLDFAPADSSIAGTKLISVPVSKLVGSGDASKWLRGDGWQTLRLPSSSYDPTGLSTGDAGYLYYNTLHGKLRVWNGTGWEELSSSSSTTIYPPPTITSFTPTTGAAGVSVVITGTYFTGATAVKFNGVDAASYTVDSATQITAVSPSGVTTGKITVTTPTASVDSTADFVAATPSYSTEVLADSPTAYWRLGEASGHFADSSGNGHDTTLETCTYGATGLLPSSSDKAITLVRASSNYVRTGLSFNFGTAGTVECLVKPASLPGDMCIIDRHSTTTDIQLSIVLKNTGKIVVTVNNTSTTLTSAATLSIGSAYHIAVAYDGANLKLYINGSLDNSRALTGALNTTNTYGLTWGIGSLSGGERAGWNGNYFDGVIDEVAFYASALSSTRIADHYAAR